MPQSVQRFLWCPLALGPNTNTHTHKQTSRHTPTQTHTHTDCHTHKCYTNTNTSQRDVGASALNLCPWATKIYCQLISRPWQSSPKAKMYKKKKSLEICQLKCQAEFLIHLPMLQKVKCPKKCSVCMRKWSPLSAAWESWQMNTNVNLM